MSARNVLVGSPVERIEDLRLLRGRGTFVDDLARDGMLSCRDPAQPGRAWAHPRDRRRGRIGAARRPRGHHRRRSRRARSQHSPAAHSPAGDVAVRAAGDRRVQGALCRRARRGRARGRARRIAEDALDAVRLEIEPLPAVTDCVAAEAGTVAAVRGARHQSRRDLHRATGRCRGGVQGRALCPARTLQRASPHRGDDGAARRARRMGRARQAT